MLLGSRRDVGIKKNPSFNSLNLSVDLKVENLQEEKMKLIKEEFEYKTGYNLKW